MKRAIVTGGAGFIGRRLVERMVSNGWDVVAIDDLSTHDNPVWPIWSDVSKVRFKNARVQDCSMHGPRADLIVHLAGKVGPVGVLKFRGQIAKDTIDSATTVKKWALEFECPLIDISTSEVYGDDTHANSEVDHPTIKLASARSEYAVAKLAAEHTLMNTDGLDLRIVRPFNISGYGQRADGGFVLPRFVDQAFKGEPLTVYEPGTQQRSFTHVDDFIDGLAIVYHTRRPGEIYNIGNPFNKISMVALAWQVIARIGSSSQVEIVDPVKLHGPAFREAPDKIPNSDKMGDMGWHPYRGTGEVVQDVIRYYGENNESSSLRLPDPEQARPYAEDAW
jgi:UDP-glucose 4-epimerase